MRPFVAMCLLASLAAGVSSQASAQERVHRNLTCKPGQTLNLTKDYDEVTITGRCKLITVTGENPRVMLKDAEKIVVSGDAVMLEIDGKVDLVEVTSDDADISRAAVGHLLLEGGSATIWLDRIDVLEVSGDRNVVYWRGGSPKVTDSGDRNTLELNPGR